MLLFYNMYIFNIFYYLVYFETFSKAIARLFGRHQIIIVSGISKTTMYHDV